MQTPAFQYDAFISYRHRPADKAAAIRLQQLLERHKEKDGRQLRIFRDQSELPTSGDLGGDIRAALEQSRYLIVVGSPAYRESKWCMAELEYFRSLHGDSNTNILPLLVEGEPLEAFPEQLHWENRTVSMPDGTVQTIRQEVEPLGADIRGNTERSRMKLLRTEYLRIAAPILGCGFDDLYQRSQRRRRNQILTAVSAVAVLAVAFSVYSLYMLNQIQTRQQMLEAKQRELYANESRRLANEALAIMAENPNLAMLLADAALPENLEDPEYPIQPEAELAMSSAALQAQIQAQSHGLRLNATLEFNALSNDYNGGFLGFYDQGRCFAVCDTNHTWILDAASGEVLATIDAWQLTLSADARRYLIMEQTKDDGIFQVWAYIYDSFTGQLLGSALIAWDSERFPSCIPTYDEASQRFFLLRQHSVDSYSAHGYFAYDGQFFPGDEMPEQLNTDDLFIQVRQVEDFALKEDAPQVWTLFEALFSPAYDVDAIYKTCDERLYFVHISSDTGSTVLLWAVEEQIPLGFSQGLCFQAGDNGLFYSLDGDRLRIYSYYPDAFAGALYQETSFDGVNDSGSRVASYQEQMLQIFDSDDLSQPLFSAMCSKYRLTPDFGYVFVKTPDNMLELYHVENGERLLQLEATASVFWCMSVRADGELAAVLRPGSNAVLEVYDVPDGECIHTCELLGASGYGYMEFFEGSLSVSFDYETWVFDLNDFAEPVRLEHEDSSAMGFIDDFSMDLAYAGDGLLVVPGAEFSGKGTRYRVNTILDLTKGESVSFYSRYDTGLERFYYDAVSGSLIDQETDEIVVQRRNDQGDFEIVYRIQAQDPTVELDLQRSPCDGRYLVLNGQEQTEIYDVRDGTCLFILPHGSFHTPFYGVIDGVLYDLAGGADTIARYALPDTAAARQMGREYLAQGEKVRELTPSEMETYYIPEEWA